MLDNNMENVTSTHQMKVHLVTQDEISYTFQQLTANNPKYKSLDFSQIILSAKQLLELEVSTKDNTHIGYIKFNNTQQDTQNLIEKINRKISDNNNSLKEYPSDYIHALISQDIYKDVKEEQTRNFNSEIWKIVKVSQDTESNYFGAIYQNTQTGSLVLTHRGTVINIFNAFKHGMAATDIKGIFQGQIVKPQFYNWLLTCEAIELAKVEGHHLSVTGHSLGAWHAELSIYFAHKDFNYHNISCINFDSPGTYTTLKNMRSNIRNHTNINLDNLDITTYNSHPNIVNSCNRHVGRVFQLRTSFNKISFFKKLGSVVADARILADLQSHSLDCIIAEFDPLTGMPRVGQAIEMKDWPYMIYKYDKSQDNKFLYSLTDQITSTISSAAALLPAGSLARAAMYVGGKVAQTVANSVIAASDTSLQSIIDILAAYYHKKINVDQLKEIYLNDITKTKDLIKETIRSINSDSSRGFGIRDFNLEYKAHLSELKPQDGHIIFKSHLLAKLDKYRRHAILYRIMDETKKHYGITDDLIAELGNLTSKYKITNRTYHHGNAEYIIEVAPQIDIRTLSRKLQKLYEVNPVVRTVSDSRDLVHRNISSNMHRQEKEKQYIDKAQVRYINLNQNEKQILHHIFFSHPTRLPYEIFDHGCENIISKLLNKHLINIDGTDSESQEIFIEDQIHRELFQKIKRDAIQIDSLRFLIDQYSGLFTLVSCDRDNPIEDETCFISYLASKLDKVLNDETLANDQIPKSLQDKNSFLLFFKFANYQFKEENPNIAHDFHNMAFEFDNRDRIISQLVDREISYIKSSLKYLTERSYDNKHCANYEMWLTQIENKEKSSSRSEQKYYNDNTNLNERETQQSPSFRERENLRNNNKTNNQHQF